jgi:hypothetical protein
MRVLLSVNYIIVLSLLNFIHLQHVVLFIEPNFYVFALLLLPKILMIIIRIWTIGRIIVVILLIIILDNLRILPYNNLPIVYSR